MINWDINSDEYNNMSEKDFYNALDSLESYDFYFQLADETAEDGGHYFMITPKAYFDTNGCLFDDHFSMNIFPPSFESLCESIFRYDGDPQVGRQLLIKAGFIEKKMF